MAKKRKTPTKEEMLSTLLQAKKVVVIDLETTGFSRNKGAEIIEIGAYQYNFETSEKKIYHSYIKPSQKIPQKITDLTGVTMDMVRNAPYEEVVLQNFLAFMGTEPVAFHNAQFDWIRFLEPGYQKIGIHITNPVICTKILSAWLLPVVGYSGSSYKLEDVCAYFGKPIEGAHRADIDAKYTTALLRKLRSIGEKEMQEQTSLLNKIETTTVTIPFCDVKVNRISPWKKGKEERLYISTTVGDIYYDYRRGLWSVQRLAPGKNLNMVGWESFLVRACGIKDLNSWLEDHRPCA